jgi:hypothetical protein
MEPGLDPEQPGRVVGDLGLELGPPQPQHPAQLTAADLLVQG